MIFHEFKPQFCLIEYFTVFFSLKYLLIHLSVSNQILLSFAAAANYNTHRTHLCAISSVIIHFPYNINNALFECFHFRLNVENWC